MHRMTNEPIYRQALDAIERDWDAFTHHLPHAHYHDSDVTAAPAPEATTMSLIASLKQDAKDLAAKFEQVDEAVAAKLEAVKDSPVLDALLAAAHVPPNALTIVVDVLKGLGEIYPKADAPAAPADAPADVSVQAEPAAA